MNMKLTDASELKPTCYGCKYVADTFGNYVECAKTAETGTHMFVDWYYWNDGCPKKCPLKFNDQTKTNN